jgi:hypothetical protein
MENPEGTKSGLQRSTSKSGENLQELLKRKASLLLTLF